MNRRLETTAHMRNAALDELLDVGPRALSQAGIARRAFFSTAAVYQRWPNRRAVIDDLVATAIEPELRRCAIAASSLGFTADALGGWLHMMTEPGARPTMQAVAEVCFAARDDADLVPAARTLLRLLMASVPTGDVTEPLAAGLRWWFTGFALGHSLLMRCGCEVPPLAHRLGEGINLGWARFFDQPPQPAAVEQVQWLTVPGHEMPPDEIGSAILTASRRRILECGVDGATLRAASSAAGVTTGAIYRRWANRGSLLRSLVAREGLGDQYRWLLELLVNASEGFDTAKGSAALEHAADVARKVWSDPDSRDFLLEMAVAAHTSAEVCERLAAQVDAVVATRETELATLVEQGVINGPLTPREITWFLQTPPIALRLMSAVGIEPSAEEYRALLRLVATMIWADGAQTSPITEQRAHPSDTR